MKFGYYNTDCFEKPIIHAWKGDTPFQNLQFDKVYTDTGKKKTNYRKMLSQLREGDYVIIPSFVHLTGRVDKVISLIHEIVFDYKANFKSIFERINTSSQPSVVHFIDQIYYIKRKDTHRFQKNRRFILKEEISYFEKVFSKEMTARHAMKMTNLSSSTFYRKYNEWKAKQNKPLITETENIAADENTAAEEENI